MKIDLNVISEHCEYNDCRKCQFCTKDYICTFATPPEQWDIKVIERGYREIVTSKAKEATIGRME